MKPFTNFYALLLDREKNLYDIYEITNRKARYLNVEGMRYELDPAYYYDAGKWQPGPDKVAWSLYNLLKKFRQYARDTQRRSALIIFEKGNPKALGLPISTEVWCSPVLVECYVKSPNMGRWLDKNIYGRGISVRVLLYALVAVIVIIIVYYLLIL